MAGTRQIDPAEARSTEPHERLLPVCVLAGGLGTRLGDISRTLPKALIEVAGEPFVFHQLRLLSLNGARRVVLCVGHMGEMVEAAVGPSRFDLQITYSYDAPGLDGTLGAIRRALGLLGDRFLVLYGDTFLPLDYRQVQEAWLASGLPAMMTVLRNDNRWGRSNATYRQGLVVAYEKKAPSPEMSWIDYGLGGLSAATVAATSPEVVDLSDLYSELARAGALYGSEATERFYEIGTPEALQETNAYLTSLRQDTLARSSGPPSKGGPEHAWLGSPEETTSPPWSEALEQLHQESSRTHFLDTWTRSAMLDRIALSAGDTTVIDVGCSTGYMLEDLHAQLPGSKLLGLDFIYSGLREAQGALPFAFFVQADAQHLPLAAQSADAIVSANLLEHVPDDVGALRQMFEALKPGARLVLVVPAGRRLYDYYDRFLHHQRRYARHELTLKAHRAGFEVIEDIYLGSLVFPAFWFVKKRNRLLRDHLSGAELQDQVTRDIDNTKDSRIGHLSTAIERLLLAKSVRLPFGVRELAVLVRPG